jgi:hypothetical protein
MDARLRGHDAFRQFYMSIWPRFILMLRQFPQVPRPLSNGIRSGKSIFGESPNLIWLAIVKESHRSFCQTASGLRH